MAVLRKGRTSNDREPGSGASELDEAAGRSDVRLPRVLDVDRDGRTAGPTSISPFAPSGRRGDAATSI